jgi:hypothetical protein
MADRKRSSQARPRRLVQSQFEPSHVARQSLAEVYGLLVPPARRALLGRLTPPSPAGGLAQERQERRDAHRCS